MNDPDDKNKAAEKAQEGYPVSTAKLVSGSTEGNAPMAPVYAGPVKNDAVMGAVYAGPARNDTMMNGIYAAPFVMTPMMTVYAGPDYFSGKSSQAGQSLPMAASPIKEVERFCPVCGAKAVKGKFCTECGARLPWVRVCPTCGASVHGKFCPQCGTAVLQEGQNV